MTIRKCICLFLGTLFVMFLASCELAMSDVSEKEKIPFLVYQQADQGQAAAVTGYWDVHAAKVVYLDELYQFALNDRAPLFWSGDSMVLNKDVQVVDQKYLDRIQYFEGEAAESDRQTYFLDGFTCTETFTEEQSIFEITYNGHVYNINVNQMDEFRNKQAYLANGAIQDQGDTIRLVFTAYDQDTGSTDGWVIVVDYEPATDTYKTVSFPAEGLSFGDATANPFSSILDGHTLYIPTVGGKFGYIDLQQQKYVQQSRIEEDMKTFLPERVPNPFVPIRLEPVGKVGEILILRDSTLYYDESTSGMLLYAYSGEEPVGKLLIKENQLSIYDQENQHVSTEDFNYMRTSETYFSFPNAGLKAY